MKVICKNCGIEMDAWDAVEFNTGRTQYMCLECYKSGCYEYGLHRQRQKKRKEKEKDAKDRR